MARYGVVYACHDVSWVDRLEACRLPFQSLCLMPSVPETLVPSPSRIDLWAGQSLNQHVASGSVLHVLAGHVEVTLPPQWMADTTYRLHRRLAPGSVLTIDVRGWLAVSASDVASFQLLQPTPVGLRVAIWFARMWGWGRRGRAGALLTSLRPVESRGPHEHCGGGLVPGEKLSSNSEDD
jgi:hypothetical protein